MPSLGFLSFRVWGLEVTVEGVGQLEGIKLGVM